jgi:transposase-like protein
MTMTGDRMALIARVKKQADGDLVREMLAFAAERIMEAEAEGRTGAATGARAHAGGSAQRIPGSSLDTRAGRIALEIPKLRTGSFFQSSLEPRRRAEKALLAVNDDDKREGLGVATGLSEAETSWTGFPRSLVDRGLRRVRLVIADRHKGVRAAARRVFSAALWRRRVHWIRNALAHAPAKQRTTVAAMLKTIIAQETEAEAETRWDP